MEIIYTKFKTVVIFGMVVELKARKLSSQSNSASSSWVTLGKPLPLSGP